MFSDVLDEIHPSQLTVKNAKESDHLACKLDRTLMIENVGKFSTRLYDKHDGFDFPIVNFRIPPSNVPSSPSLQYIYISQLDKTCTILLTSQQF